MKRKADITRKTKETTRKKTLGTNRTTKENLWKKNLNTA